MSWNKYDYFLFFLIALLAGGGIGGALTMPRVATIIFLPYLFNAISGIYNTRIHFLGAFFCFWFVYGIISIIWTSDPNEALKQVVYYFIHFTYFLEIVSFACRAKNPLKSICFGWLIGFSMTAVISIWELITDNHLSSSKFKSGAMYNAGGGHILVHRFCAATFSNYNDYVTYLCCSFPFMLYLCATAKKCQYVLFVCIVMVFVFIGYNASRGGLLAIVEMLCLFFLLKERIRLKNKILILIAVIVALFAVDNTDVFSLVKIRLENTSSSNNIRLVVWSAALDLWASTYYIGTGLGGMMTSMKDFSNHILITHNMFLEILVEFGFVIFVPFIFMLVRLFVRAFSLDNTKFCVIISTFVALPFISIINSGYLLSSYVYAFFSSLFVLAFNESAEYSC